MTSQPKRNISRVYLFVFVLLIFLLASSCVLGELFGLQSNSGHTATADAEHTLWAMTYAEEDRVNDDMTATARSATQVADALTREAQSSALTETAAAPNAPVITGIDFPGEIPSDKSITTGLLYFTDPNGDVGYVTYEVVSATNFNGATDNAPRLDSGDWSNGAIEIYLWCEMPQAVTLRATLYDNAGNHSNAMDFSFTCQ